MTFEEYEFEVSEAYGEEGRGEENPGSPCFLPPTYTKTTFIILIYK